MEPIFANDKTFFVFAVKQEDRTVEQRAGAQASTQVVQSHPLHERQPLTGNISLDMYICDSQNSSTFLNKHYKNMLYATRVSNFALICRVIPRLENYASVLLERVLVDCCLHASPSLTSAAHLPPQLIAHRICGTNFS